MIILATRFNWSTKRNGDATPTLRGYLDRISLTLGFDIASWRP